MRAVWLCGWIVGAGLPFFGQAQEIVPGEQRSGAILTGSEDSYTFTATMGDQIIVRAGTAAFTPRVELFGPGNVLLGANSSSSVNNRDGETSFRATNSGTFTVAVSAYYSGGAGSYDLNLSKAPGEITVSTGDDGGLLTNAWRHTGTIEMGDLDQWNLAADAGDSVVVRMGGTGFTPRLRVYGPDGELLDQNASSSVNNRDGEASFRATSSGVFTVVASSYYLNGSGNYILTAAKSPGIINVATGDNGGPLTNNWRHSGVIEIGDVDQWSFSANPGDSIILRAGGTNFTPLIRLFDPQGLEVAANSSSSVNNRDGEVSFRAIVGGTYTVVLSTYYLNGSGGYALSLATSPGLIVITPGDEGGPLTNGWQHVGENPVGDLDAWDFEASSGDSIVLRAGGIGFTPLLRLYGPDGSLLTSSTSSSVNNRDAELSFRATNSGVFTLVLSTYYLNGSGPYQLNLVKSPGTLVIAPGDEGGPLTNGWQHVGENSVGDLDAWDFEASSGDSIVLRAGGIGFTPLLRLYGPDGSLLTSSASSSVNNRDAELSFRPTNSGVFTLVQSTYYLNGSGPYQLNLAKSPGAFVIAPGDDGGQLLNSKIYKGQIEQGDSDVWTFTGCIGERVSLEVTGTNFTPWIRLYGRDGALVTATVSFSVNTRIAALNYFPTNCGTFTVLLGSYYLNGTGGYQLVDNGLVHAMRICPPMIGGTNVVLFGAGGPPGEDAVLTRTADLRNPTSTWTEIVTRQFDAFGVFSFIDRFSPTEGEMFYQFYISPE